MLIKRLFLFAFLLLAIALPASGQSYTTVTGTATDVNAAPYAGGSLTASFVNTTGQQALFGGNPNFQKTYSATLDSTGSFTLTLPSNASIAPTGTQWSFTACTSDGENCFSASVTISGASQSISASLINGSRITFALNEANQPPCPVGQTVVAVSGIEYGCSPVATPGGNIAFTGNNTHSGAESFTGAMTFSNHNQMYWAGPGATPTIDQAVANCAAPPVPCFVTISPGYTGPESANLTTTSTGYKVYAGANSVTIEDMRAGDSGVGTPTGTPMYPITYGGRSDGELSRESVNYWCSTPTDSCVGLADYVWFQGTFPTNGGAIMGSSHLAVLHDSVTVGASSPTSPVVGTDAEVWLDSTTQDRPVPYAQAYSGQVMNNRTPSTGRATIATAYHAQKCNDQFSLGLMNTCYGFDAEAQAGGAQANYGLHTYDGILGEINSVYDFTDAGNVVTTTSMAATTATYNTTGVCLFTAGQRVAISGVLTVTGGTYNGIYPVLGACGGGTSFTVTLPFSGLGASSGGLARGLHTWTKFQSSDSSITHFPMLDSAGEVWKRNSDSAAVAKINSSGVFGLGTVGCTGSGNCFLGGTTFEFAGLYMKETSAPTGAANDTVCGGESTSHTLQCSYNNGTVGTVPLINRAQTWSAAQTFNSGNMILAGVTSGTTTLNANATAGSTTATLPANTGILAELNLAQTFTATQTFAAGSGNADIKVNNAMVAGNAPTCSSTGSTSPTCTVTTGSTNTAGTIQITVGTSPAALGTVTLTFSGNFGTNPPVCIMVPSQLAAGQWNARATIFDKTPAIGSDLQNWDNNAAALTASTAIDINYHCWAK
jgi:hypothetical protein